MSFQSNAVRNLIELHEVEMDRCLAVWKEAKARNMRLPKTEDPAYQSLEALLQHILGAGRGYLTWMCEVLGRPDPGVPTRPEADRIAAEADTYTETVLAAWRTHLEWMTDEIEDAGQQFLSRWKQPYTIDQMLEHALAHPMRHRRQLERMLSESSAE